MCNDGFCRARLFSRLTVQTSFLRLSAMDADLQVVLAWVDSEWG